MLADLDERLHAVVRGVDQILVKLDAVPREGDDARASAVLEVTQLLALAHAVAWLLAPHDGTDQHRTDRDEGGARVFETGAQVRVDHHHAALVLREHVEV